MCGCSLRSSLILILVALAGDAEAAKRKPPAVPPAIANATPEQELQAGERFYDDYNYERAIATLKDLLEKNPANATIRQRARLLLSFSYYFRKDEPKAKSVLADLLRENVDYPLDRELHHPDLVRFYDTERNAYVASLKVAPASVPVIEHVQPAASAPSVTKVPDPPKTTGDRHPWVRILPGGIGHLFNHDYAVGAVFISLEVALIGMNVATAILRPTLRVGTIGYRSPALELQILQDVGAIGTIAVAVFSIIDAFAWSPARGRKSLEAAQKTVDLGPLGAYHLVLSPIIY
jgi:hypothetical protein